VHHFARQLGSPFPLLAACGAKTRRIELGTAVIDMRYENPMYMAEDAGAAATSPAGACNSASAAARPSR
jgi:alkanesulfonate monooxygenase SsuD/methylene tetrahydromethanopterin reductase-like flavin-dependent oxidoreductase (luciferase family)